MGRITSSSHIVFNEVIDSLLDSLYKTSKDKEKKEALESIIRSATSERAAYTNGNFCDPLDFILLTSKIKETQELIRLEKRIDMLLAQIKDLETDTAYK